MPQSLHSFEGRLGELRLLLCSLGHLVHEHGHGLSRCLRQQVRTAKFNKLLASHIRLTAATYVVLYVHSLVKHDSIKRDDVKTRKLTRERLLILFPERMTIAQLLTIN